MGIKYELLSQEIFQIILNQSEVKNINVQHDVVLEGKSTNHQIDVYWEFELNGICYKTIVQTKYWNKSIDKGELLKFKEVLNDLPDQPRGIFVTRTGYQKGAYEVAKANGIQLFELQEIEHDAIKLKAFSYAKGKIIPTPLLILNTGKNTTTFQMELTVYESKFENKSIVLDPNWLCDNFKISIDEAKLMISKIKLPMRQPFEHKFYDAEANIINDMGNIYKEFMKELEDKGEIEQEMYYEFKSPTFYEVNNFEQKLIKVLSITTNVIIKKSQVIKMHLKSPNIVKFVLKDLAANTVKIIGKNV